MIRSSLFTCGKREVHDCNILSDHHDGDLLVLAQIYILIGLFNGRAISVQNSMDHYATAGKLLRILLDC